MADFKFVFTKTTDIIVEAQDENDAWVQVSKINPEFLGAEWQVNLKKPGHKEENPLDEPVEIDDWGPEEI